MALTEKQQQLLESRTYKVCVSALNFWVSLYFKTEDTAEKQRILVQLDEIQAVIDMFERPVREVGTGL